MDNRQSGKSNSSNKAICSVEIMNNKLNMMEVNQNPIKLSSWGLRALKWLFGNPGIETHEYTAVTSVQNRTEEAGVTKFFT